MVAAGLTFVSLLTAGPSAGVNLAALQEWDIVISEQATPSEKYAAREFQQLFRQASGLHKNCFGRAAEYGLDQSLARTGLDCFNRALELADDPTVRSRVEKASVSAYRLALEPVWYVEDKTTLAPEQVDRLRPLAIRFIQLCRQHGVTRETENKKIESTIEHLQQLFELPQT